MRATTITTKKKARMKKKTTKTRIAGRANQSVRPALPQRAEKRNVARRSGARYVRAGRLSTTQTDTPINTHAYTPSTHANSRQSPTYLDDESETDANIPRDTWDVLWERLEESDEFSTAYIYRLDANDEPQKPFLLRCGA